MDNFTREGVLFDKYDGELEFRTSSNTDPAIVVDTTVTFQTMDGFGNCLTGGSAILLNNMSQADRSALLNELFRTDGNNLGVKLPAE